MGLDLSWAFKLLMTEHKALYIPACHFLGLRWFPTHFSAYALLTSCVGGQCIFSTSTSLVYTSVRIKERNNLPESQTWISTSLIHSSKNTTRGIRAPALLIRIPNQCIISSNWLIIQFHGSHSFTKLELPQRYFILQQMSQISFPFFTEVSMRIRSTLFILLLGIY